MKSSPLILMFFYIIFIWNSNVRAAEEVRGLEMYPQPRYAPHHDGFFDFDDYDATMASLEVADRQAEHEINTLYAPLDNGAVPINIPEHPDEEDNLLMQKILAESLRTAEREQIQREVDVSKEKIISLNEKIGKLTEIVEKSSDEEAKAELEELEAEEAELSIQYLNLSMKLEPLKKELND